MRKMTNREWLETLSDEMLASEISTGCVECGDCVSNIVKEFEIVFQDRRAISLDEIKSTIRGLFE